MDRKLLDYLPPVLREVLEFQAINAANEPEISIAWDALALVLANQFLDTATASGVAVWERELNIRPKDTDTLEVRKARIKALWNLELPYTCLGSRTGSPASAVSWGMRRALWTTPSTSSLTTPSCRMRMPWRRKSWTCSSWCARPTCGC